MPRALVTGLAGTMLSADEARFLAATQPCGIILFARNCRDHAEIRKLIDDARSAIGGADVLVLIDQEGGRVQRLRPPLGRALPPAARYGAAYARDAQTAVAETRRVAHLLAADLAALGINTDCAPVLDVPVAGAHDIIGDRAFATTPAPVAALGRAFAEGLMHGGLLPVVKHIPGHGRATADSHLELPTVHTPHAELSASDFAPFKALADMPAAMSAHVVFSAFDAVRPASISSLVHDRVIRGEIGFSGLLMSDDLSMRALSGTLAERAAAVVDAGSDIVLHCNGNLDEMQAVAAATPPLAGRSRERFERAMAVIRGGRAPTPTETSVAEAVLHRLLDKGAADAESV